jgi:hypothetical protein
VQSGRPARPHHHGPQQRATRPYVPSTEYSGDLVDYAPRLVTSRRHGRPAWDMSTSRSSICNVQAIGPQSWRFGDSAMAGALVQDDQV